MRLNNIPTIILAIVIFLSLAPGVSEPRAQADTVADEILYAKWPVHHLPVDCVESQGLDCSADVLVNLYYSKKNTQALQLPGTLRDLPETLASFVFGSTSIRPESCNLNSLEQTVSLWKEASSNGHGLFVAGVPGSLRDCFAGGIRTVSQVRETFLLWQNGRIVGWVLCDAATCQVVIPSLKQMEEQDRLVSLRISLVPVDLLASLLEDLSSVVDKIAVFANGSREELGLEKGSISSLAGANAEAMSLLHGEDGRDG